MKPSANSYRKRIYDVMMQHGGTWTDRELMNILGATDPNSVRPEVTRLIEDGILRESGKRACPNTGRRRVRATKLTGKPLQPLGRSNSSRRKKEAKQNATGVDVGKSPEVTLTTEEAAARVEALKGTIESMKGMSRMARFREERDIFEKRVAVLEAILQEEIARHASCKV